MPGQGTRWLAARASAVCAAFGEVRTHLPTVPRVRVTGTPVRGDFLPIRLSDGSERNCKSPAAADRLGRQWRIADAERKCAAGHLQSSPALTGWRIFHQTGGSDSQPTATLYGKLGLRARVAPFFHDLPQLLAGSGHWPSAAAGSTLAELAICGVPAILLPYPQAADDHQRHNAERFVAAGAARMLDSRQVEGRLDNALARELSLWPARRPAPPDVRRRPPPGPPRRGRCELPT